MSRFKISNSPPFKKIKYIKINYTPHNSADIIEKYNASFKGWLQKPNIFENVYK